MHARLTRKTATSLKMTAAAIACAFASLGAQAAQAPAQISIGTLYASTGPFAVASQGQYEGLKFWADTVNKQGGVLVKAYGKKIPVKIVAYDDQSSTSTATTLYNQLITQDKVDILVADFGSVLTSVAVPLAAEHHMLLIDPTGSGANFFTQKTDYLADVSIPSSTVWPVPLANFLLKQKIKRVAIVYGANDFDASQAETMKAELAKGGVTPVFYHSVPTTESNYNVLLHTAKAANPQALLEFGYAPNDIAFLRALSQSGLHFDMTFTIFPGQLLQLLTKNAGVDALAYTYTYPTPPLVKYDKVTYGMNTAQFVQAFQADQHKDPTFLDSAGYNTGIVMEKMLGDAPTFAQPAFHQALMDMSGKTTTLLGPFQINANGAQLGQPFPVAQMVPDGNKGLKFVVVYPDSHATGKPVYPAPTH
ncbi:amino acid ABC transporter substrate-binding protein [Pandoraea sp. XJJ-1]|uniref:Amino acid ABC transporter substrate-binding protein n=1 Tax=Pandoraea cepalis TaxID=2508294 RepID=A0A5E4UDM7_9BURK|nr:MULTISPECIES: amino acid ABC transporter substrate-binding protein [Pandoraea]MDN4574024.1 amino acid ABC transporter substrate-binding protein [Pandoraea cepalis]MDN4580560.1 amino acid ABC transporter substrate-binding protein [Pandoraea cepalis]OJY19322.1 MAG: amino acid ABC transporter substrate-binding protein [Pandoraea sp. 64-18]QBC30957.1 amino acid ABC transporter substrate-binding protein [Pandoraea sp. XY-2]WAL83922.1 amino acid ABC transporter substrate-binding protein [Pandorae